VGARKTSKKRKNPDRHKAFLKLREDNSQELFTLRNGAQIIINPMKKFLLRKEYSHPELRREVLRLATKQALGNEKYNELTQGE
jgi:hypothetical protein